MSVQHSSTQRFVLCSSHCKPAEPAKNSGTPRSPYIGAKENEIRIDRVAAPRAGGHTTHVDMYAYAMPKYIHTYIHTYLSLMTCQPNTERFINLCVRTLWRHAATAREAAKVRKYQPICDRIDAQFRGAVIERHGQCGDGMCSIIKLLSGDGERDLMQEDTSFTAPSRTTYVAQHLVFAAVMADAAMVDDALASALHRLPRGRGARS